jgi:uncharacterized membrane protein YeiH
MILYLLDLCGVAVFAVSGAIVAARRQLDVVGVLVIASVTAVGGGTLRDLLLGIHPVFWIRDPTPLIVACAAGALTLVYGRRAHIPRDALLIADALGLGLFCVTGAGVAERAGAPFSIALVLGAASAVAGGVIRDVLCAHVPLILRQEIYATAAIAGAGTYLSLERVGVHEPVLTPISVGVAVALRLAAVLRGLHLPVIQLRDDGHGGP